MRTWRIEIGRRDWGSPSIVFPQLNWPISWTIYKTCNRNRDNATWSWAGVSCGEQWVSVILAAVRALSEQRMWMNLYARPMQICKIALRRSYSGSHRMSTPSTLRRGKSIDGLTGCPAWHGQYQYHLMDENPKVALLQVDVQSVSGVSRKSSDSARLAAHGRVGWYSSTPSSLPDLLSARSVSELQIPYPGRGGNIGLLARPLLGAHASASELVCVLVQFAICRTDRPNRH